MFRRAALLVLAAAACDALVAVPRARAVVGAPRPVGRTATETEGEIFEILEAADDDAGPASAAAPRDVGGAADDDDDESKRSRVLLYMGFSLLPILALVPFLGSRDFVPADPSLFS